MRRITKSAFTRPEDFEVRLDGVETVTISFGPTTVSMTLDAAFGLQWNLASVLAGYELEDYPEEAIEPPLEESRKVLVQLAEHRKLRAQKQPCS